MAIVKSSMSWSGSMGDVLSLWVDDPRVPSWLTFSTDHDLVALFLEVDEDENETGRVAGLEIVGFLEFEAWDELPDLGLLWQVADWEPLPLVDLLQREQQALRQQQTAGAA